MLPVEEAAVQLKVTPHRVRAMIAAGQLKAEKKARVWDIDRRSFNALKGRERKVGRPRK